MSIQNHNKLIVESIDDILRCSTLSSLLEVSGYPKPGNIHRTKDFTDTRFEHFLAAIAGIQPEFRKLCRRIEQQFNSSEFELSDIQLGVFFKNAAKEMMKCQK